MNSMADGLPPDVAKQIHPDWRKNEADYWAVRDSMMRQYRDRWIAFAEGAVIATGTSPVEVFHKAQESGKHPYVTCVGREHEPCRMRRIGASDETRMKRRFQKTMPSASSRLSVFHRRFIRGKHKVLLV